MRLFFKKCISLALCLAASVSLFVSNDFTSEAKSNKTSKNIVVVLDPGHDSTHIGCHYENFEEGLANLYIAYYCKQELEKYSGVTVYMTRYGFDCPYGADQNSKSDCLTGRVDYAKSVGANVIVSLHNDYDPDLDASQNGSKVIIPNPNYKPSYCVVGQNLAKRKLQARHLCCWYYTWPVNSDSAYSYWS